MEENQKEEVNFEDTQLTAQVLNVPTKETVKYIKNSIITGDIEPARAGVFLKKFAKIAEEVKKDKSISEMIITDTKKHQDGTAKTFQCHGAKITLANRGYWDYSKTNDPLLEKLQEIEKDISERIKLRKKEIELKLAAWENENKPKPISASEAFAEEEPTEEVNSPKFGMVAFPISWDALPELKWNEGWGEVQTNPPTKRNTEQIRYTV